MSKTIFAQRQVRKTQNDRGPKCSYSTVRHLLQKYKQNKKASITALMHAFGFCRRIFRAICTRLALSAHHMHGKAQAQRTLIRLRLRAQMRT
eukprot:943743-Pleurochrysis_carterae.AAC.1